MKQQHPSQHSTPKRSRSRRTRVHFQPPPEETPFSRPAKRGFSWRRMRFIDAVYLVVTVVAGSTLIGLCHASLGSYLTVRARLTDSTTQLNQLKTREASLNQRLAQLNSPEGRDQLLRERGFVHGNERILLFADASQRDQQPHPQEIPHNEAPPTVAAAVNDKSAGNDAEQTSFLGGVVRAIDNAADRPDAH